MKHFSATANQRVFPMSYISLVCAAAILATGCSGPVSESSSCPGIAKFNGKTYIGETLDSKSSGRPLEATATIPPCNHPQDEDPSDTEYVFQIARIPGVDPEKAFVAPTSDFNDLVYIRESLDTEEALAIKEKANNN